VHPDGLAADKVIAEWGYSRHCAGLTVAGLVQLNALVLNPSKCDMAVGEFFSGAVFVRRTRTGSP
jgi:hypothetical protein